MKVPRFVKAATWCICALSVMLYVAAMTTGHHTLSLGLWLVAVACLFILAV